MIVVRQWSASVKPWLFLLLCLLPFVGSAQTKIDSLRQRLLTGFEQQEKYLPWAKLVRACSSDEQCLEDQITWARSVNDSLAYDMFFAIGLQMIREQAPARAIGYSKRGVSLAAKNQDTIQLGRLLQQVGYAYTHLTSQSDSAAHYLYKSIEVHGEAYRPEAWLAYYSLGYLNDQLGLPDRALAALATSYTLSREGGKRMDYGFALFHLLQMSLDHKNDDYFREYWPQYVELRATSKSIDPRHDAFLNLLKGDDASLKQLRAYADRADIEGELDPSNAGLLYSSIASGYASRSQFELAEEFVRKAIANELAIGREGNLFRYYQQLAMIGEAAERSEWVADGLRGVQRLQDSMIRKDYQESISRLEVEFETQKTKAELAESQLALSESKRLRNQLLIGGIALGVLLLVGFLYYQDRLKLQRLQADFARDQQERELAEVRRKAELSNLRSLIEGQETERTRVAKDLHDGLGGLLTTVKAHIASTPGNEEASTLIDRACTSVRRIAHNMVPQTLADTGLSGSLNDLAAQLRVQGYEVDLEVVGQPDDRLDLHQQSILLRIAQELTHNVVKHANAKSLLLQLIDRPEGLLLTVEDDGKGFNLDHAKRTSGLGLGSIEQRVAYLEGEIMYDSRPGQGTTVTVEVDDI